MSHTTTDDTGTTDGTRTPVPVPDAKPLAGLTGASALIYAELVNLTDDNTATASELAAAAGLGRSTTGKALVTLEERGLAVRTPGGHDGPRRVPDLWCATPTGESTTNDAEHGQEHVHSEPTGSAPNGLKPSASGTDNGNVPADESTPDDDKADTASEPVDEAAPGAPAPDAEQSNDSGGDDGPHHVQGNDGAGSEGTAVPQADPGRLTAAPVEAGSLPDGKKRLAPGALRQMVIDHLSAHPGEAFTATRISRVIEKSSGAIANALDKLVQQNIAEQMSDQPRTYRLATPQADA